MAEKRLVPLTRKMILAARSRAGGWTRKQLQMLGVAFPPPKGWLDRVERELRRVTWDWYFELVSLRRILPAERVAAREARTPSLFAGAE